MRLDLSRKDLWWSVFLRLDYPDLCRLKCACRQFRAWLSDDRFYAFLLSRRSVQSTETPGLELFLSDEMRRGRFWPGVERTGLVSPWTCLRRNLEQRRYDCIRYFSHAAESGGIRPSSADMYSCFASLTDPLLEPHGDYDPTRLGAFARSIGKMLRDRHREECHPDESEPCLSMRCYIETWSDIERFSRILPGIVPGLVDDLPPLFRCHRDMRRGGRFR